jgi:metal-responsive CopG/Arc/MetJ family transcriptional regulator
MRQNPEILQIRLPSETIKYLSVLTVKYKVNRSQFVRDAIMEKLKRDVPKLRIESNKEYLPF